MAAGKLKLTDALVKAIEPAGSQSEFVVWDTEVIGFGLRVRARSKTFIVTYRPAGGGRGVNAKRFKIGSPQSIPNVREAHRLALATLGRVAAGGDPAAERAEERRLAQSTIRDLLDRYDVHLRRRGHVKRTDTLSLLRRRLKPLLRRDIASVKAWEYAEIIERLDLATGGTGGATFRTRCSTFLNWATFDARVLETNPLAGYRRKRDTRQERVARVEFGRALSDVELSAIWRTADPETAFGRLVRFLVLTGCRRSEGSRLVWSMVDLPKGRIDLPATFTKQARGHTVYVSPMLNDLLTHQAENSVVSDFVFPSARTGGPMSGWSKAMDPSDKRTAGGTRPGKPGLVKASGVSFTLHDLRRTFRTGLSRLGVENEIAELALGHARADLEARYNRDDCETALRSAFLAWDRHVEENIRDATSAPSVFN
ncbi:site-specific integrase [Sulfitobacter porphyrae]|uniref:Site-specific integrase n=1 Tax=Sulfitobacter porphyrae TaxID=1246864 RepID=A0ABW2B5F4_9RHOB|nr:integrase [Sulfitobacter porphyrae]